LGIVAGGVLFNLVCEFWVHGLVGFLNPVLTASLILLYATYFLMLEDLVVGRCLGEGQVLLAGVVLVSGTRPSRLGASSNRRVPSG